MSKPEKPEITQALLEALRRKAGTKVIAYGFDEIMRLFPAKRRKEYTCTEIARDLGVHHDTIYSWFKDYPGVIEVPHLAKRMKDPKTGQWKIKKKHAVLLIPYDVFIQFCREHAKVEANGGSN
jgi:Putative ATPase subunit of terminase (gpP-like)